MSAGAVAAGQRVASAPPGGGLEPVSIRVRSSDAAYVGNGNTVPSQVDSDSGLTITYFAQPTYIASGAGGDPVLRGGGHGVFSDIAVPSGAGGGISVLAVLRLNSTAGQGVIVGGGVFGAFCFRHNGGKLEILDQNIAVRLAGTTNLGTTTTHLAEAHFDGVSAHELVLDGASEGTATIADTYQPVNRVLRHYSGSENLNADVVDILVFTPMLTPSQIADWRTELQGLYAGI